MLKARAIRTVGRVPLLSKAARWYANRYPEGSVTTIRSGYAAGLQWRRHHRYVNGFWTGQFELPVQEALHRELKPGGIFYDVGANAGFFALVAWNLVGAAGRVVAIDPDPANIESIEEQFSLNRCENCRTIGVAVSDHDGVGQFSRSAPGCSKGRLGANGEGETFDVPLQTLDGISDLVGPANLIKLDVEGAEVAALQGAHRLLAEHSPKWLIEVHDDQCAAGVRQILTDHKYRMTTLDGAPVPPESVYPVHILAVK
jgi:FkbM family methyltransferase